MQNHYLAGIVGLVAAVGIVVLLLNVRAEGSVAGAAVAEAQQVVSYSSWTTCIDQGNQVKLGNKQGDSLVKKDVCTGSAVRGKQIAEVFCVSDAEGDFSYKYGNPHDCPSGTKCLLVENGAAYCE